METILYIIIFICLIVMIYLRYTFKKKIEIDGKRRLAELQRFRAVLEAEENRHTKLASDILDGPGQKIRQLISENTETVDILEEAYHELEEIAQSLMPKVLYASGLISATEALVQKIDQKGEITIKFQHDALSVNKPVEIAVYRIIVEVLDNMVRHARPTHINIEFRNKNNQLYCRLIDNGVGFDLNLIETSIGLGWKSIFSRVEVLRGKIDVKSGIGEGSQVEIWCDLE